MGKSKKEDVKIETKKITEEPATVIQKLEPETKQQEESKEPVQETKTEPKSEETKPKKQTKKTSDLDDFKSALQQVLDSCVSYEFDCIVLKGKIADLMAKVG